MVERTDWGDGDYRGGETGRQVATVSPARQTLDDIKPGQVVTGTELARLAEQDGALSHQDQHAAWRDREGRFVAKALPNWLELKREMSRDPAGYADNLQALRGHVDSWLANNTKDPAAFVEMFEELSVPVQDKILTVFRRNPSASFDRLSAKVRQKLTLEEAHEVSAWLRK